MPATRRSLAALLAAVCLVLGGAAGVVAVDNARHPQYQTGQGQLDDVAVLNVLNGWALGYDIWHTEPARGEALMRDAFTQDARFVFHLPTGGDPLVFEGIDAVMDLFVGSLESQDDVRRHVTTNNYIERLDRRTTRVTSYLTLLVVLSNEEAPELRATGIYTDTLRLRNGVWRISERVLHLDTPS